MSEIAWICGEKLGFWDVVKSRSILFWHSQIHATDGEVDVLGHVAHFDIASTILGYKADHAHQPTVTRGLVCRKLLGTIKVRSSSNDPMDGLA